MDLIVRNKGLFFKRNVFKGVKRVDGQEMGRLIGKSDFPHTPV
jgi:hypothetical protein